MHFLEFLVAHIKSMAGFPFRKIHSICTSKAWKGLAKDSSSTTQLKCILFNFRHTHSGGRNHPQSAPGTPLTPSQGRNDTSRAHYSCQHFHNSGRNSGGRNPVRPSCARCWNVAPRAPVFAVRSDIDRNRAGPWTFESRMGFRRCYQW